MEKEVADLVGAEVKRGGGSEALSCAACGPEFSSVGAQLRLPGRLWPFIMVKSTIVSGSLVA